MGEPLWSARMRIVIPVRGLLTATSPSLAPDKIISPAGRGKNRTLLVEEEKNIAERSKTAGYWCPETPWKAGNI